MQDNGGPNSVNKSPTAQTISWNLTGTMAQGSFNAISNDPATSGFSWIDTPPAGTFGTPVRGSNGNSIDISDHHADSTTNGTWKYQLRATLNGQCYSTTGALGPTASVHDPIIINR